MKALQKFLFLGLFLFSSHLYAQDLIIKTNSDTIFCKIFKYHSKNVIYSFPKISENDYYIIDKDYINYILINDSIRITYSGSKTDSIKQLYYAEQGTILKYHLFSPIFGHAKLSIENYLGRNNSLEFGASYIFNRPMFQYGKGFAFEIAFKHFRSSPIYKARQRHPHNMQGFYIKPMLLYTSYSSMTNESNSTSKLYTSNYLSLVFTIGKQFVIGKHFVVDWYVGGGFSYSDSDPYNLYNYNQFNFPFPFFLSTTNYKLSIAITAGFSIGFLFN